MYDLLIKNANIVTCNNIALGSIAVSNGKIESVYFNNKIVDAKQILDLNGKYLFPGFIDCHVHFDEPGYTLREDFKHGTAAAAIGGITTVIDMPLNNKPPVSNKDIFKDKYNLIKEKAFIDYGFWGALVNYNMGDLDGLNEAGALAFKSFICDAGKDYTSLDLREIEKTLLILKKFNGLAGFHCEDYDIIQKLQKEKLAEGKISSKDYLDSRPLEAELIATKNVIALAEKTDSRIHICHVSHPLIAEEIRKAKAKGIKVTGETCTHYLMFTGDDLIHKGMLFKCSPPLRTKEACEGLWEYICDGTLDCICSDHSPGTIEEKTENHLGAFGAWGGLSGVQTTVQILFDQLVNHHKLSPSIMARVLSKRPAEIFGIYGIKGDISNGFDADFTVIDQNKTWIISENNLKYLNKISAFVGLEGKGAPIMTIVRGKIIAEDGSIVTNSGYGSLIKRNKSNI